MNHEFFTNLIYGQFVDIHVYYWISKAEPHRGQNLHRAEGVDGFLHRKGSRIIGNILLAVEHVVPAHLKVELGLFDGKLVGSIHKQVVLPLVAIVFRRKAHGLVVLQEGECLAEMPPIGDFATLLLVYERIQFIVIQRIIYIQPFRCLEH